MQLLRLALALVACSAAFAPSSPRPPRRASVLSSSAAGDVYDQAYGTAVGVDQAAYGSTAFWDEVRSAVPGMDDAPSLDRFRGFVDNLRTDRPGEVLRLANGQELLAQYVFPGLEELAPGVPRTAFPALPELESALRDVAPLARDELAAALRAAPLADDHARQQVDDDDDGEGGVWNRAAWFGWQFMSIRDAKQWMPKTVRALSGDAIPAAHRFVGVARQRADCRGSLHSDQRNYLLSTVTGLQVPEGHCGIVVPAAGDAEEARLLADGQVVVLDNTFPHFVYNNADRDRFVLMAEVWHPGLSEAEVAAMKTLFAVKDKFTLLSLKQCPWGYSDDELMRAIAAKDHLEIGFWRDASFGLGA